jgi:hypothetical protein
MRLHLFVVVLVSIFTACTSNNTPDSDTGNTPHSAVSPAPFSEPEKGTGVVKPPVAGNSTDSLVNMIHQEYQRINSTRLTTTDHIFQCKTASAKGLATYYTRDGKVVKIAIDWGLTGNFSRKSAYYFQNDKLIFVFNAFTAGEANQPEATTEERIYIHNDQTLRYLENKKELQCRDCTYTPASREYKLLQAFYQKKVKNALCE